MDVIAKTAFGIDLDLQSHIDHEFVQNAGTFFSIPRKGHFGDVLRTIGTVLTMCKRPSLVCVNLCVCRLMRKKHGNIHAHIFQSLSVGGWTCIGFLPRCLQSQRD